MAEKSPWEMEEMEAHGEGLGLSAYEIGRIENGAMFGQKLCMDIYEEDSLESHQG